MYNPLTRYNIQIGCVSRQEVIQMAETYHNELKTLVEQGTMDNIKNVNKAEWKLVQFSKQYPDMWYNKWFDVNTSTALRDVYDPYTERLARLKSNRIYNYDC